MLSTTSVSDRYFKRTKKLQRVGKKDSPIFPKTDKVSIILLPLVIIFWKELATHVSYALSCMNDVLKSAQYSWLDMERQSPEIGKDLVNISIKLLWKIQRKTEVHCRCWKALSAYVEYKSLTLGWGKKFVLGTLSLYSGSDKEIHKQKPMSSM